VRVVALTCSNTEIVCALGCAEQLVALDAHSDYPADVVRSLPRVGPDLDIDVARVAAAKPDLVLASLTVPGHERVLERLAAAKLPFVAPEPKSVSDVYANIRQIAELLGVPERAAPLIDSMRAELDVISPPSTLRLLVEWWPKPIIAPGRASWVHQLLLAAGLENPLADRDVASLPLTDHGAAELLPDASVIAWCGVRLEKYRPEVVLRRSAWQELELVRRKRVFCISEAWLGRPGPRLVEGVRALRRIAETLTEARG
jgi:iron complex transport system substrate-binding protein